MNRSFVSVIVPLYQSAATVAETLASIRSDLDRSGIAGEVIVVNDGSRDMGPEIVRRVAGTDARVRLINQSNKGLAGARNTGLDHAACTEQSTQHWVRFLDADDLAVPGSTEKLMSLATRLGTGAACGGYELIDEAGSQLGWTAPALPGPSGTIALDNLLCGNRMGVGTVLLRRDLIGPMRFDERLRVCEDWDLWLRLAQNGVRFAAAPAWCGPMKLYRVRRGSLSKDYSTMANVGVGVLRAAFSRLGGVNDPRLDQATRAQTLSFAAMQAVSDAPDAVDRALALLPSLQGWSPEAVAEAILWGVLLGRGESPDQTDTREHGWRVNMSEWLRLAMPPSGGPDPTQVSGCLARLAVRPDAIAKACVRAAVDAGASEITLIGLGLNGMRVAQACRRAEVPFVIRDERLRVPLPPELAEELAARIDPPDAPMGADPFVIVSPESDVATVQRLQTSVSPGRLIRWSEARDSLAKTEWVRPRVSPRQPVTA